MAVFKTEDGMAGCDSVKKTVEETAGCGSVQN